MVPRRLLPLPGESHKWRIRKSRVNGEWLILRPYSARTNLRFETHAQALVELPAIQRYSRRGFV